VISTPVSTRRRRSDTTRLRATDVDAGEPMLRHTLQRSSDAGQVTNETVEYGDVGTNLQVSQHRPAIPTITGASSVSAESASTRYCSTAATLRPSHFAKAIGLLTTPTGGWSAPSIARSGRDSTRARISVSPSSEVSTELDVERPERLLRDLDPYPSV
jgi:hypothetical protein